jgi:gas vesicle protein
MWRHEEDDDDDRYVVIEKHSGSVSSFLLGLGIGAGIALLMAPRSGAATRRQIRRGVEKRIDAARDAIDLKKQQVHRAVDAGRAAAEEARLELEQRIADRKTASRASSSV